MASLKETPVSVQNIHDLVQKLIDKFYPVGTVYESYESTSPADLFGGTWVAMEGVFPYFNSGTEMNKDNKEHYHTFTIRYLAHFSAISGTNAEMIKTLDYSDTEWKTWNQGVYSSVKTDQEVNSSLSNQTHNAQPSNYDVKGRTSDHESLPPYQELYAWRRVA